MRPGTGAILAQTVLGWEPGGVALLAFLPKEIGPSLYNAGVADAQIYVRDRVGDLEDMVRAGVRVLAQVGLHASEVAGL
jgi:hypothetical protein